MLYVYESLSQQTVYLCLWVLEYVCLCDMGRKEVVVVVVVVVVSEEEEVVVVVVV